MKRKNIVKKNKEINKKLNSYRQRITLEELINQEGCGFICQGLEKGCCWDCCEQGGYWKEGEIEDRGGKESRNPLITGQSFGELLVPYDFSRFHVDHPGADEDFFIHVDDFTGNDIVRREHLANFELDLRIGEAGKRQLHFFEYLCAFFSLYEIYPGRLAELHGNHFRYSLADVLVLRIVAMNNKVRQRHTVGNSSKRKDKQA